MSLFYFAMPIQVDAILEDTARELHLSDKELAAELGYEHFSSYSKAKHGVRPFDLHHICAHASDAAQQAFHRAALAALKQRTDRDLVADLVERVSAHIAQVDSVLAAFVDFKAKRQVKAELKLAEPERRSA
jgi:hypothetical protein